ncbi:MAG: ABC transporter ATP-binding protein [Gemmatimonadales bacterium]
MTARLALTGLTKRFGVVTALDDVTLEVARGEIVAVVGESGAGKSTLARCAVGLVPWNAGEVWHEGAPISTMDEPARRAMRRRAQLVLQDAGLALDPRQRVGDALAEARAIHGLPLRDNLLDPVGLPRALTERFPHEVSGGQRQRVLLARALAVEPDLLLLDEPTAALDTLTRARLLATLDEVIRAHRLTAMIITHDVAAAAQLAHRVVVLEGGRVVESGPTMAVVRAPAHPYTRRLMAAAR